MPQIRQLPTSVINKIAAGEVIERPASVVKELMENSVDAGATRIDVAIEKGGTELIRIADDGCGIEQDQLELAVTSHATSKIFSAEELFSVGTMGFRGEALASIAEVCQFLIRSRVAAAPAGDSVSGYELVVNGGQRQAIHPCGCPIGTIMEVRNLFFNTPVRRKFLKTPQTETGHITEAFTRIALANPHIYFTLSHNGKSLHELPPSENWAERIGHFFGDEIQQNLIPVSNQQGDIRVNGYAVSPAVSRSHNRMQYLFLNGRYIRDRALQHALSEAYRGLLMTGRFPVVFLQLKMPPDQVDVNVHPAKLEVRFQESGRLYSQLLATLRSRFLSADLTEKVRSAQQQKQMETQMQSLLGPASGEGTEHSQPHRFAPPANGSPAAGASFAATANLDDAACNPEVLDRQRQAVGAWARGENTGSRQQALAMPRTVTPRNWTANAHAAPEPHAEPAAAASSAPSTRANLHPSHHVQGALGNLPHVRDFQKYPPLPTALGTARPWPAPPAPPATDTDHGPSPEPAASAPASASASAPASVAGIFGGTTDDRPRPASDTHPDPMGGLHDPASDHGLHAAIPTQHVAITNRCTVMQIQNRYLVTEAEDGMVVIDQHALHERILYEQVKAKVLSGNLEYQTLLVPQPVDLSPAEAAAVLEVKDDLLKIGLTIEAFGGSTILVSSYPSLLHSRNLAELIHVVVDQLSQGKQRPDPQDLLDHLLSTIACKAAIKAGNRLSQEEMQALIEHRHLCQDAHHCPHGRPSWLVFSREELDKKFKRI